MTPSELKYNVENKGSDRFFFTRDTMRFFGDTMANYGCRDGGTIDGKPVYELWRKRAVKHGSKDSAYFCKETFARVLPPADAPQSGYQDN